MSITFLKFNNSFFMKQCILLYMQNFFKNSTILWLVLYLQCNICSIMLSKNFKPFTIEQTFMFQLVVCLSGETESEVRDISIVFCSHISMNSEIKLNF